MKIYAIVLNIIYKTQLDARIGFVHELQGNRHSLALDIADIFKPVLSIYFIIYLVNSKKIKREHFKFRKYELNEEGLFLINKEFQDFIKKTIYIEKLKRHISLKKLIQLECYKLIKKMFDIEKEYNPYIFKNEDFKL